MIRYTLETISTIHPHCSTAAYELLTECWAGKARVAERLLQFLTARDALHLSCVCRTLNSTLRCTSVPSVHLFLLMRQAAAGPGQALKKMQVPWGRCPSLFSPSRLFDQDCSTC